MYQGGGKKSSHIARSLSHKARKILEEKYIKRGKKAMKSLFFRRTNTLCRILSLILKNNTIFGNKNTDLPELEEAEVWLREIRKGLAAEKKAGVGGNREEERGEQAG